MRRVYFFILLFFGMALAAFGQASSSDSQTLQALLTEVRELRKVLQVSITKMQGAQILLARLQIQEVAVTRASQHLDDARSRLAEVQLVLKSEAAEIKHWEDEAPNANETPAQIEEAVKRAKSDIESATNLEQQRQAIETEAELQLRTEKDKLNALETQLDELVRNMGDPNAQPGSVPR
jgi:type I site-specific restriction-modification system R (restriction) subunit